MSAAVLDLIERAKKSSPEDPLYVVPVGAITNVANAILPRTVDHQEHRCRVAWREWTQLAPISASSIFGRISTLLGSFSIAAFRSCSFPARRS